MFDYDFNGSNEEVFDMQTVLTMEDDQESYFDFNNEVALIGY